jgi:hypothetical protein
MFSTLHRILAVSATVLALGALLPLTGVVKAQPGRAPFRPGFLPYVPPGEWRPAGMQGAVSYTHLTLPTTPYV